MINRCTDIENIETVISIEIVNNADLIFILLLVVWDWYNYLWDRLNYDDGTEAVVNTVVSGAESKVATDRL